MLLDMFNSFMASPDQYTSALGFQRSKRSTCDKVGVCPDNTEIILEGKAKCRLHRIHISCTGHLLATSYWSDSPCKLVLDNTL
jgi:hypothetical protein